MTTADKVLAMRDHLAAINPEEMPAGPARDFAYNLQMARGLGWDPFELVLPDDPHELDEMIDGAIGLLLELRGDDLPTFRLPGGQVPAADVAEIARKIGANELTTPQAVIAELGRIAEVAR